MDIREYLQYLKLRETDTCDDDAGSRMAARLKSGVSMSRKMGLRQVKIIPHNVFTTSLTTVGTCIGGH